IGARGSPLRAARLYDSTRRLIAAMLARLGAEVTDLGILSDRFDDLAAAMRDAAGQHDLVITSGGVSTGEADHVRQAVETIGRLVFWRVAIKPGRPVAMGIIPAGDAGSARKAGPDGMAGGGGLRGVPGRTGGGMRDRA